MIRISSFQKIQSIPHVNMHVHIYFSQMSEINHETPGQLNKLT